MNRRIFLLPDGGGLCALVEESFVTEEVLQTLLADYPDLLAGDQIDEAAPRRWLLVHREAGVPDRVAGADRWSLDHLFLDQEGVPTLVEVKRSSDTRIRREVIGQMLDYAANGRAYWPVEKLRALFEAECEARGHTPADRIQELLGEPEPDVEDFWQRVKTNLQAGRIRMVFVADEIPPELRRVVEFLNEQMDPAEVLAVAVRQYVGDGLRTLVPQLVGQTAEAQSRKAGGPRPKRLWDEESFFAALEQEGGSSALEAGRRVYNWAQRRGATIDWGEGIRYGSCVLDFGEALSRPLALWSNGVLEVRFQYLAQTPPFDDEGLRRDLLVRLNRIAGVSIPGDAYNRWPNLPLEPLADESAWALFEEVFNWVFEKVGARAGDAGDAGTATQGAT